jgi:hypothetical protein
MMINATLAPKVGFVSPFGTTVCNVNHINALGELRPTGTDAGTAKKRALWAVSSSGLIMIEASPSAYHRGMLTVEMKGWLLRKEETS